MMDKKEFDTLLIGEAKIEDVINYFGVENILENISSIDIADYCDDGILRCISDEDLINAVSDPEVVLNMVDDYIIANHLEENGYTVLDTETEDSTLQKIKKICKEIQPNGYIDKEDAKKLICEYIDFWMTKHF